MFSLFPTDPKKALLQTTGLAILAGADPGQALSSLPVQIAQLQNQADEMALRREQLGISKSQLAIQQAASEREQAIQDQKAKLGAAMQAFNLNPSSFGGFAPGDLPGYQGTKDPTMSPTNWSGEDMVAREYKGDPAMPLGQEGNPIAKKIMALPLSVRQSMADAPLVAADMLEPALKQGLAEAFTDPASTPGKAANVVNLRGPRGDVVAFDIGDPTQRTAAQQKLSEGYVEENPQTPKDEKANVVNLTDGQNVKTLDISSEPGYAEFEDLTKKGWFTAPTQTMNKEAVDPVTAFDAPYRDQINAATAERAALDDQVDDMSVMGSLLLRPDIYSGAGATAVNSVGKTLQDTLGLFPDIDFSAPINAEQMRKSMALSLKSTLMKDPQMSTSDRKYLDSIVGGLGGGPEAISRGISLKVLEARYAAEKETFLQEAIRDRKLSPYQAIKEWNKQKSTVIRNTFNEQNINALMTNFADGANDQSLLDYVSQRLPAAEAQVEKQLGIEPKTDIPDAPVVLKAKTDAEAQKEFDALPSGAKFVGPDGLVRQKP